MKKYFLIILLIGLTAHISVGQKSKHSSFKSLKKVECEGVNEQSSEKEQMRCLLIEVVTDSINYSPMMSRKSRKSIHSAEDAYDELLRLYTNIKAYEITCWTEYKGYYVFSFDCGMSRKRGYCAFVCMIYIPIGGDEFWYFVPRT